MTPGRRGGRPRDPEIEAKVLAAARSLLAQCGMRAFVVDRVAARAGVGKASIYRRWRSLDEVLVDVVRGLGLSVDHSEGPGTLREDLVRLLLAATTGLDAAVERAVLSALPNVAGLQAAYEDGPLAALYLAVAHVDGRSAARGEPAWPSWAGEPIAAGVRLLQVEALIRGEEPTAFDAAAVVEQVVLPALGCAPDSKGSSVSSQHVPGQLALDVGAHA